MSTFRKILDRFGVISIVLVRCRFKIMKSMSQRRKRKCRRIKNRYEYDFNSLRI